MTNVDGRIILMFSLVVLFVTGGIVLNYFASREQVQLGDQESRSDEKLIEYVKSKADNFSQSAKLLFDFGKIALGALITLLSTAKAPTSNGTLGQRDVVSPPTS